MAEVWMFQRNRKLLACWEISILENISSLSKAQSCPNSCIISQYQFFYVLVGIGGGGRGSAHTSFHAYSNTLLHFVWAEQCSDEYRRW